jgi:thiamine biosynthesis protein ThiI
MDEEREPNVAGPGTDGPGTDGLGTREVGTDGLLYVVRPAPELAIKAPATRNAFRKRLKSNLGDAVKRWGLRAQVRSLYGRLMVRIDPGDEPVAVVAERARDALSHVFGVGSFSPAEAHCHADLDTIVEVGRELFAERVKGRRYAVRCKRTGGHAFGSMDVERGLGAALNEGATVDLDDPEVTVSVEVNGTRAVFFSERLPGPGGLPLGTGGRALALLSGGYDSVVAAWYVMKRGVEVDFLHCRMGGAASERLALQIAKVLTDRWAMGSRPDFYAVDFATVVEELQASSKASYWQVVLKRQMLRTGDGLADRIERDLERRSKERGERRKPLMVDALVTGEVVAQVSSQTLSNLRAIDGVAERPVLRPLAGLDKLEIIRGAEHIGTAALSAQVREFCAITPGHPVTSTRPGEVERQEGGLEPSLLATLVEATPRRALRALTPADLMLPYLYVDALPAGAIVLDGREEGLQLAWRPEGAVRAALPGLLRRLHELDKEPTYVLFCRFGTRSAQAAEVMQQAGFEAYSFRGGERALRAHLEAAGRLSARA